MNQILLHGISLEELVETITNSVAERLSSSLLQAPKKPNNEKLLTRAEAAAYLRVTLPTLDAWHKEGAISAYRIGVRVFYKESELLESLKKA